MNVSGMYAAVRTQDSKKMVRTIRDRQYKETKSKSFKELIQYFQAKAAKLHAELDRKKSLVKIH